MFPQGEPEFGLHSVSSSILSQVPRASKEILAFLGKGGGPHIHVSQHDRVATPAPPGERDAGSHHSPARPSNRSAIRQRDPPWPGTPGSTDRLAYSGHTDDRVKIKTLCSVPSLLGWLTAVIRTSSLEEWEVGKRINSRKQTHQDESGGWTCVVWCGQGGTLENRNKGARLDDLCASMQKPR